jgi:sec-independent protein translocase protein TatC
MADEPDEAPLELDEDEGGPVKSFLEHLEDLRWTIIRSGAAIIISMIVCLVAGDKVIAFLKRPLEQASRFGAELQPTVFLEMSGVTLGRFDLKTNVVNGFNLGSNTFARLELEVVNVGSNQVLGLRLNTNSPPTDLSMVKLSTLGPMGGFMVAFQVAIYAGIGMASPFLLLFIGQFLLPALRKKEKDFIYRSLGVGIGLFLAGVAFCYLWVLPATLKASAAFSEWEGFSADQWRAEEYMSFICKFMLGMGVSFELPIVILAMVKIGLLDYPKLAKFRAYFVIVNLFLSALISPGADIFSMVMMAIPLQVLYEISLWIAWFWYRAEKKQEALENV